MKRTITVLTLATLVGACGGGSGKAASSTTTKARTSTTTSVAQGKAALCADVERLYQDEVLSQSPNLVASANSVIDRLQVLAGPGANAASFQSLRDNANKGTFFAGMVISSTRTQVCGVQP